MTNIKWLIGIVVALIIGVAIGVMYHAGGTKLGAIDNGAAIQNYPFWFTNGTGSGNVLYAGKSQQMSVNDNGDVTASSTALTSGCIQFNATSTATTNHIIASSTATINGHAGILLLGYGACQ